MKPKWLSLTIFFALCFVLAGWGGLVAETGPGSWYDGLQKPRFSPPAWIFGPAWSLLYILIGVSGWLVWRGRDVTERRIALLFWGVQLLLHLIWFLLFFAFHLPGIALLESLLLWFFIGAFIIAAVKVSRRAALLFLPYWAWITLIAFFNLNIWWLN